VYTVATGDHAPHCFAGFGINAERLVADALRNLEAPDWLSDVSGFVNVSRHCLAKNDSGDICCARNMQLKQRCRGLLLGEAMSAHDSGDGIGDLRVADYLAEFDEVHVMAYPTPVLDIRLLFVWSRLGWLLLIRLR
jgi:hypothetical protein